MIPLELYVDAHGSTTPINFRDLHSSPGMLSASRARYSRYPTTRLFYSTVQSVHGKVVNDLAPKPLDYKERGFRRAQVKRSQLAADAYDLHRHQDRRRRRKITRAFVTKTLEDEELLRRADRSAAGGTHTS